MTESKEIYIDIPEYEGLYQVSNFGNVRSLGRVITTKNGWTMKKPAMNLKIRVDKDGYSICTIYKNGRKDFKVHRLVMIAFTGIIGETVNHIDGNKKNNHVSNLEWCSQTENNRHALRTKLREPKYGLKSPRALDKEKVIKIKNMLSGKISTIKIAKEVGVSQATVSRIKRNETYQDI